LNTILSDTLELNINNFSRTNLTNNAQALTSPKPNVGFKWFAYVSAYYYMCSRLKDERF